MMVSTGRWLRNDTPRHGAGQWILSGPEPMSRPVKMPFMYSLYCTARGRSRPRLVRMRAAWSAGQIRLPHMVAAGSAGTAKNSRNVVTDTAKRVKTASRTRRMKKRSIGGPFRGVDLFGFAVAGGFE